MGRKALVQCFMFLITIDHRGIQWRKSGLFEAYLTSKVLKMNSPPSVYLHRSAVMAYLHCWTRMQILTFLDLDSKPNGCIVLCRTFHIAQTWTWIPTPYFSTGQESEFVPECISGNINEP